jgi:Na+:H+ antiporter, NhaA family
LAIVEWLHAFLGQLVASLSAARRPVAAVDGGSLSDPVDPEVDHIRGSHDAPLVLVEYGDFECPNCLPAEAVLQELSTAFGDRLAFVFRHLPLGDVHQHARLAAEAAESAAQ